MDIILEAKKLKTNAIFFAAEKYDEAEVNRIREEYQKLWDDGISFLSFSPWAKRDEDTDEEIKAAAQQIIGSLEKVVVHGWLMQYSRDEIITLSNLLVRGPDGRHTKIKLVADTDLNLDVDDIVLAWNDLHPEEKRILPPDPAYGI